jgi:hypothetical protein
LSILVLIATTHAVSATALHAALVSEHRRFAVLDATGAAEIVSRLVDPVIAGLTGGTWDPGGLKWGSP